MDPVLSIESVSCAAAPGGFGAVIYWHATGASFAAIGAIWRRGRHFPMRWLTVGWRLFWRRNASVHGPRDFQGLRRIFTPKWNDAMRGRDAGVYADGPEAANRLEGIHRR
jgi:hypothetical protein